MRGGLAIALLASFQFALLALFRLEVPESNRDLVNFMLGQLSIMAVGALGYYFNTSKSSQDKTQIITDMQGADKGVPILDLTGSEQE
jgi:UDP-N-acetylmuramyl pentapeptide phosphotransferase/UDP-N-acetylglucosamine-1-phosphate transferase